MRIRFGARDAVPVLLQNENGPCPLLALANVLLLRGSIELGAGATEASQSRLLSLVAGYVLDRAERLASGGHAADNVAANVEAALERVPKLATGIDVNIRFAHPRAVEFTDEVALFDLAGVGLVHGWVMAPDEPEAASLGTDAAYNATAALAVEAGGGAPPPPPPPAPAPRPPARSLLDEDWPPAGPQPPPSAPQLPGLEPVLSADLADALEAKVGLGDRRRAASSNGGDAVSALVSAAVAEAAAAAAAAEPATSSSAPPTSDDARSAKAAAAAAWLARTATQLTPAGLVALHDPEAGGLAPGELAAFFRNSHFSVAYARPRPADPLPPGDVGGGVFTLVTDVGYRGRGVAWERLDGIDGDTTLVGPDFRPPGVEAEEDTAAARAAQPPTGAEDADRELAMRLQAEEDAAARAAQERARAAAAERAAAEQRAQQAQQQRPLRRPGSGGLLGFGSGRRLSSGSGEKCVVM